MERAKEMLEELIGYRFRSPERLDLALRHRSAGLDNNERLEFLGDAVLSFIISGHLACQTPPLDEATMTRRRSLLTDRTTLNEIGLDLGLEGMVELGAGMSGRVSQKMVSDTVEALIGAVFIDGGVEAAREVVYRLVLNPAVVDRALSRMDWITIMKEWCDMNHRPQPKYVTFESVDDEGKERFFQAWLTIDGHSETGTGISKKKALAETARRMIGHLDSSSEPR